MHVALVGTDCWLNAVSGAVAARPLASTSSRTARAISPSCPPSSATPHAAEHAPGYGELIQLSGEGVIDLPVESAAAFTQSSCGTRWCSAPIISTFHTRVLVRSASMPLWPTIDETTRLEGGGEAAAAEATPAGAVRRCRGGCLGGGESDDESSCLTEAEAALRTARERRRTGFSQDAEAREGSSGPMGMAVT